jgi:UDP-N-acetyl-D-galactosamine dehydrogenase
MSALETIAIVGLGYVGLPLAVAFGTQRRTIGLDLNEEKLTHYRAGHDPSGEVEQAQLSQAALLEFTSDAARLRRVGRISPRWKGPVVRWAPTCNRARS